MTRGVIIAGRNAVCVDAVGIAVMDYDPYAERGTFRFIRADNSLRRAEAAGTGTRDLKRIEVVELPIKDAQINFGPGAVGEKRSELNS